MIRKMKISECSGCHACYNICPKQCIDMECNQEGFLQPHIDDSKCIQCHACEKVCPALNKKEKVESMPKCYAAYSKQQEICKISSSGGIFSLLAEVVLSQGGCVFGAAFNENFDVQHICVDRMEDLAKLRGSKYVQSSIGNTYLEAKRYLEKNRVVLFTGTPCQIEGLLAFLGKTYDNLITQDIVCHGVPSPKVWREYIASCERKFSAKAIDVSFRDKEYGWEEYQLKIEFANGKVYKQNHNQNYFMRLFLKNIILRESCYQCACKGVSGRADITLGDFWGIADMLPSLYNKNGVSLLVCHTEKGRGLIRDLEDKLHIVSAPIEYAVKGNPCIVKSVSRSEDREFFFRNMECKGFNKSVELFCDEKNAKKLGLMKDAFSVQEEKGNVYAKLWYLKNWLMMYFKG